MRIAGMVPFSLSDFPGTVASIVFTQGCNFRCSYCHNAQLIGNKNAGAPSYQSLVSHLASRKKLVNGIVISGGEPTIQAGLQEFIQELKGRGFRIKLDTNGSNPDVLASLLEQQLLDYVAMDIKAPYSKYDNFCSRHISAKTVRAAVEESVHLIRTCTIPSEFRTTVQHGILQMKELCEMASYTGTTPFYLQQYRNDTQPVRRQADCEPELRFIHEACDKINSQGSTCFVR